jgi:hypothetical protein
MLLMNMWGKGSAGAIQFLHSWHAVGMTVSPLLAAPFMSPTHCESNNSTNATTNATSPNSSIPAAHTRIQIPYAICGSVGITGGIILLVMYAVKIKITIEKSTVANRKWKELLSPATCAGGKLCFGITLMLLLFFIYFSMVGKDQGLTVFLEPIVVEYIDFTKTEGALLLTSYAASYTMARFLASILSVFLPLNLLFFVEMSGNLGAAIALSVIPLGLKWHLWVFVCLFGFFAGPIYPCGMAWADQYVEMTALGVAVIDFGIGLGSVTGTWLTGYLFTYFGPIYPMYLSTVCAASLLVLVTAAQIVGSCNGKRERQPN